MNLLYFAALCGVSCAVIVLFDKESVPVVEGRKLQTVNAVEKNPAIPELKLNKIDEFKNNIKVVLSKAFFSQKDVDSAKIAVTTCIKELQEIIDTSDALPDYILGYRAIISFLDSLMDKDVYNEYVQMIDTTTEIKSISEAFAWLAAAMTESRAEGFSAESIKNSVKQRNVLDHVNLIINKNIFPHLFKRQRDFLMPILDICENTLISSGINNEPGPEDGPDIYASIMHMSYADAKELDNKIKILREFAEGIADRIEHDSVAVLNSNVEKLREYMENVGMLKIELSDKLIIKPTQTMKYELIALCDNTINKIHNEIKKRKNE